MLILPNNERKTAAATKNVSVTQQCHECFNNRRIIKLSYQKLKNFNIALGDFLSFLKKCVADKCLLESENSRLKQEISDIKAKYENDLFNMREALNETHNKLNFFEANTKSLQDRNKDDETRCLLESENSRLKQEVSNIKVKYENDLSNMREALNETHKLSFFETYTKFLQDKNKDLEARLQRKSSNLQKQCIFTYNSKMLESVSSLHCLQSNIQRLKIELAQRNLDLAKQKLPGQSLVDHINKLKIKIFILEYLFERERHLHNEYYDTLIQNAHSK